MDLNSAWVFVKVIQNGSFSGAARQLQMPVSTVSTHVSRLERRLGATLLMRTTRQLRLTDAGQRYFAHATRACAEIQAAEASTAAGQVELQGLIRVTAATEMGASSLADAVASFLRQNPGVQIELVLTDRLVDLLSEGIDLAVRVGALDDSGLIAKRIGVTEFQVFASPAYLKRAGEPRRPADLARHARLGFQGPVAGTWDLCQGTRRITVPVRGPFSANHLVALQRLATLGHGVALLPAFLCGEEVARNRLRRVLVDWVAERNPVHLVYPNQKYVPRRVRALIDHLSEGLKDIF